MIYRNARLLFVLILCIQIHISSIHAQPVQAGSPATPSVSSGTTDVHETTFKSIGAIANSLTLANAGLIYRWGSPTAMWRIWSMSSGISSLQLSGPETTTSRNLNDSIQYASIGSSERTTTTASFSVHVGYEWRWTAAKNVEFSIAVAPLLAFMYQDYSTNNSSSDTLLSDPSPISRSYSVNERVLSYGLSFPFGVHYHFTQNFYCSVEFEPAMTVLSGTLSATQTYNTYEKTIDKLDQKIKGLQSTLGLKSPSFGLNYSF